LFDTHHWPDEAGRAAYLAGLHAAHDLRDYGPRAKRHSTAQGEFVRLVKDDRLSGCRRVAKFKDTVEKLDRRSFLSLRANHSANPLS